MIIRVSVLSIFSLLITACASVSAKDVNKCTDAAYPDWATSDYVLPYPPGKSYPVELSHCSSSYHGQGQPDEFATDFKMRIKTPITASRAGRVVGVVEKGRDGGFPNNLVAIQHDDGTIMVYMHLTKNGALVEKGDVVTQGQLIGKSGNTGLAGYPHLHLVLIPTLEGYPNYKSIPFNFRNTDPNPRGPSSNTHYRALPYTPN